MDLVREKLWTREFVLSCLANLLAFASFYFILTVLPLFVTEVLGGDKGQVGYIFSIFAFSSLLARPLIGKGLDKIGRHVIARVSVVCLFLTMLVYNSVTTLWSLLLLRAIHGVCWGGTTTSLATLATDFIPAKRRGEGIGYYGLSMSLAMFMAPILALAALQQFTYASVFYTGVALAALALICVFAMKKRSLPKFEPAPKAGGMLEKRVFAYAAIVFCLSTLYSGILSFIVLFAKEIHVENSGVYFLANALTLVISRPYAGTVFDKQGPVRIMCVGLAALAATFICLYFAASYVLFILSALCLGVGFGIIHSTSIALAINKVDAARRGVANGTILTAFDLGMGIGATLLGLVANYAGLKNMYLLSGLLVMIPFGIFYATHMANPKTRDDAASVL